MWQQSLRVDYTPIVDVRTVKPKKKGGDLRSAVLETAKYPVKPIKIDFSEESLKQVNDLHVGLAGKRQLAYGGLLREIKKELGLEDVETSDDLVHVDEETGEVTTGKEIVAAWDWQRKNYYVVHGEIPVAEGSKEVWT
jgi:plasmid rolling circle replication initiator protein Rep